MFKEGKPKGWISYIYTIITILLHSPNTSSFIVPTDVDQLILYDLPSVAVGLYPNNSGSGISIFVVTCCTFWKHKSNWVSEWAIVVIYRVSNCCYIQSEQLLLYTEWAIVVIYRVSNISATCVTCCSCIAWKHKNNWLSEWASNCCNTLSK